MFDLSLAEILLVVVVAVIFIGPKELPAVLRAVAKGLAVIRALAAEFRKAFDDLSRETGLKDMQEEVEREVRFITGDDGKQYRAYDMPETKPRPPAPPPPEQTDE